MPHWLQGLITIGGCLLIVGGVLALIFLHEDFSDRRRLERQKRALQQRKLVTSFKLDAQTAGKVPVRAPAYMGTCEMCTKGWLLRRQLRRDVERALLGLYVSRNPYAEFCAEHSRELGLRW